MRLTATFFVVLIIQSVLSGSATVAAAEGSDAPLVPQVRAYRQAHEKAILEELTTLIAAPNVAANLPDIERNVQMLQRMLERRDFAARVLSAGPGTPPSVFAERKSPGSHRTVIFYAHFDGQPVTQTDWASAPFDPVVRDGPLSTNSKTIEWRMMKGPLNPEWRIFGRSASDDKGPIVALLSALDALKALAVSPRVNIKFFFEGEEEAGSQHLRKILTDHIAELAADLWIFCDGPMHASRRQQVYFGARVVSDLELTVYGALRPLHSGHYGNWAPNPAVALAHLIARMRDENGRILIPGFYDEVRPLTAAENAALASVPDTDAQLKRDLGLGRSEGRGPLMSRVMEPALNVRGLKASDVGARAANSVPMEAQASIDFRLVPDQTPQQVRSHVDAFLRAQGWFLTETTPDLATRLARPKVLRTEWSLSYAGARADLSAPVAKAVIATIERTRGEPLIVIPMLGGRIPMSVFTEVLRTPVIGVPMVNHDNYQHGANENLRLQNLWDGIELYAGLMADLTW